MMTSRLRHETLRELADKVTPSQQTVQAYEVGRRRIQVAALPVAARTLSIPLEELFGEDKQTGRSKRGPTPSGSSKWGRLPRCRVPSSKW